MENELPSYWYGHTAGETEKNKRQKEEGKPDLTRHLQVYPT